jgi:hypothetical protein
MKIFILILMFAASSLLGQNLQQATFYRLYRTNLYSFAVIASSPYRENYTIAGTVRRKDYDVAIIEKDLGTVMVFNADRDMLYAEPGEMLKMLYVKDRLEKTGGKISAGEWFSWDSVSRSYATPTHKTQIYILNNCPDSVRVGETISCYALPVSGSSRDSLTFDYGKPFVGHLEDYPDYFEVRPTAIVKTHRLSDAEIKAKKEETTQKIVEWQKKEAATGSAISQYDLGVRYLKGDGLEKDEQLALHWLKVAATNGNDQAVKLLSDLSRTNGGVGQRTSEVIPITDYLQK